MHHRVTFTVEQCRLVQRPRNTLEHDVCIACNLARNRLSLSGGLRGIFRIIINLKVHPSWIETVVEKERVSSLVVSQMARWLKNLISASSMTKFSWDCLAATLMTHTGKKEREFLIKDVGRPHISRRRSADFDFCCDHALGRHALGCGCRWKHSRTSQTR